jgi:hypothetical protein
VLSRGGKITIGVGSALAVLTLVWSLSTDYAAVKASVVTAQNMVANAREVNLLNQGALERRLQRIEEKVDRLLEQRR